MEYYRDALRATLVAHQRMEVGGSCSCGWGMPGGSFAEHILEEYEWRMGMINELLGKVTP